MLSAEGLVKRERACYFDINELAGGNLSFHEHRGEALSLSFNLTSIVVGHTYPPVDITAEIGRITIAAARVDRQLTLVLSAIKYPIELSQLLTWSSSKLFKVIDAELERLFEDDLLSKARRTLESARKAIDARHSVAHNIWNLNGPDAAVSVAALAQARTQHEIDNLLRRDVESDGWQTLHPKNDAPGPESIEELESVRTGLENAVKHLDALRFTLASALFAGSPPGAKEVLDPYT